MLLNERCDDYRPASLFLKENESGLWFRRNNIWRMLECTTPDLFKTDLLSCKRIRRMKQLLVTVIKLLRTLVRLIFLVLGLHRLVT